MSKPQVVIYGASGYTGKLIAWHLAERGIPFIAAGRTKKTLEKEMKLVPELKKFNAQYECVACSLDVKELTELFKGAQVVYNCVGPFMQLSDPVAQAALDAGCHYMDTTGEQDWMLHLEKKYGAKYKKKELLLCPANAWMWTAGNIACEIALETPGIDTLDVLYMADSNTSEASTASFLRMLCRDQLYLKNGKMEVWPHTESYDVLMPGEHQIFKALPWSGAGEPTWYRKDKRIRNCSVLVAFRRPEVMQWVIGRIEDWYENHRDKSFDELSEVTNAWGEGMVNEEPPREDKDENRSTLSVKGRGRTAGVSVVMRGNCPYIQAGVWAAESTRRILNGQLKAVGYQSPTNAFGHRELAAAAAELDLLTWEVTKF